MQIAEIDGRRVIVVLLGCTPDAWYADAEALLDYGIAATAVPGTATRYGQISFANTTAISSPAPQPFDGLAVTAAGAGASLVSRTDIASSPRRSPWLWIIMASVLAPASLLTLAQVQRGLNRRAPRSARRPATRVPTTAGARGVYRDSAFAPRARQIDCGGPAAWQHVAPDYRFDETTDWRVTSPRQTPRRRDDHPRYPAFSPSYGGD
ncbi:MAG: hypothetical protein WD628_00625, partial [Thermomicrobiales bacterium]